MQSVPITTDVVSLNSTHGEVYSIQPYVIKFVNDLRQVGGFLRVVFDDRHKHNECLETCNIQSKLIMSMTDKFTLKYTSTCILDILVKVS